ncbi:hypothetical protein DEI92_03450 [Curtobacterium sp. MCBD17_034]|uniref:hypothetical protein n=1 Tax=unclassified Curtobacterium TaxID=257496 RepID=UPI000DA9ED58|nr:MULTISPECIES: hypothetical protein [unclassified Curtobacterium]PZF62541.1 hypothetical protein DEI92_03450 [Curtobacterium sp. MCBD17_034]PZM39752.1 hypothetical protein DEI90_02660 [Curtobacterium sp. MCBD17_031]
MTDWTTSAPEALRTYATLDSHGGKVSKRVEVLTDVPSSAADGRHDGMVAVRGPWPTGALDEHAEDGAELVRGTPTVGWVDPATLRDWYRPDLVIVPLSEAHGAGLRPGLFADTRTRGRVRIDDREGHVGPDGRPAFRALAGSPGDLRLDAPLPRDEVVRVVEVRDDARTEDGASAVAVLTTPVLPVLAPGVYPDHAGDRAGLPPAPAPGSVRVRAFWVEQGERAEIVRLDAPANTMWVDRGHRGPVPVAVSGVGPDLVRYVTEAVAA